MEIKIIGIDMGHSLNGKGTGASKLLSEVVENRKIGLALIQMLRAKGYTVIDCTVDYAESTNAQLGGIVKKANAQKIDLFVSIHLNAGGGQGKGTETYTFPNPSQDLLNKAREINTAVANSCNFVNRGLKTADYYVLNGTVAPAVLVEVCFVDHQEDKDKLNTQAVAKALFKGITGVDYAGETFPSKPVTPPATTPEKGAVKATALNVRSGAGTGYSVIGQLKAGETVRIHKKVGDWYSIYFGNHGGYVHSSYIVPVTSPVNQWATVTADVLNVRAGAGTGHPVIGQLHKGEKVKIHRVAGDWYSIYFGNSGGYVSKQYLRV